MNENFKHSEFITTPKVPIRIKEEVVEHLTLFHRIALEELVSRGKAEIVP